MKIHRRNPYFDALRAIAIIMVIANYTCSVANLDMLHGFNFNVLILQVIKCAVPLFLAISGYFLCRAAINNKKEYFIFLRKHLSKIYIPMLIFSLPYILAKGLVIRSLIGRTFLALVGGFSVYYFIFLIAQYYILLPTIKKTIKNKWWWGVFACISICSIITITYINIVKGMDLPLFIYAGLFPLWIVFFALGCYLRNSMREYNIIYVLLFTICALASSYVESYYLTKYYGDGYGIKLSVFLFSGGMILLLFSKRIEFHFNHYVQGIVCHIFEKVGQLSFFIYLSHIYVIQGLDKFNLLTSSWYLNIIVVSVVCVLLAWIANKTLPTKIRYLIGL